MKQSPSARQLLLLVVACAMLPSVLLLMLAWRSEQAAALSRTRSALSSVAALVELSGHQLTDSARMILKAAAAAPAVKDRDVERCNRLFAGLRETLPAYSNLGALDRRGRSVCSAVPLPAAFSVADRWSFGRALQRDGLTVDYEAVPIASPNSLTFLMPFRNAEGDIAGVVFASLGLEPIAKRLRAVELPEHIRASVMLEDGLVLASSGAASGMSARPVTNPALRQAAAALRDTEFESREPDGGLVRYLVRPLRDVGPTGMAVVVRAQLDEVLAPVDRRLRMQLLALLAAAVVGSGLAWALGHASLVRPASRLLERMRLAEQGRSSPAAPDAARSRELAQLDAAFSVLWERLQGREREREELLRRLQAAQVQLLAAQRVGRLGYWEIDLASERFSPSSMVAAILGHPGLEQQGGSSRTLLEIVPESERPRLEATLERAARGEGAIDEEHRVRKRDGSLGWIHIQGELERSGGGEPLRLYGSIQDITARKAAELRLRHSESLLQIAGRVAQLGGWSIEPQQNCIEWSQEVASLLELDAQARSASLEAFLEFCVPQQRESLRQTFRRGLQDGTAWDLELEFLTRGGQRRWMRIIGEADRDSAGRLRCVHGALQDLSDRKAAERSLAEMAQQLTQTLESITDGFYTLDREWRFSYVNSRAEALLRRDRASLIGRCLWDEFDPAELRRLRSEFERAMREQRTVVFEASYAPLDLSTEVRAYPSAQGLAVYFHDITEQKRAERERMVLLASERSARREAEAAKLHFRALFESAPGLYIVLDPSDEYRIVAASEARLKATYTRREDIIGKPLFELFPDDPSDPQADGTRNLRASLERVKALRRADVMAVQRYPIRRPPELGGGFEERYWSPLNSPVFGPEGELVYIIHRVEDVTEFVRQKEQEGQAADGRQLLETRAAHLEADIVLRSRELQRLNEQLRLAQHIALVGSWEHHLSDGSLFLSEETQRILGLRGEGVPARFDDFVGYVHADDRPAFLAAHERAVREGEPLDVEYRILHRDEGVRYIHSRAEVIRNDAGRPVQISGTVQDISQRRQAEQRLQEHLARMELLHRVTRAIGERRDMPGILRIVSDYLEQQLPVDFCMTTTCADGQVRIMHVGEASQRCFERLKMSESAVLDAREDGLARAIGGELVYEPDTGALSAFELPRRLASADLRSLVIAPLQVDHRTFSLIIVARVAPAAFGSADCEFLAQLSEHVALAMRQAQLNGALETAYEELRRTQQAALQHERLRAVGEMASGIAHDINNAISPVMLYTESLLHNETGLSENGRAKLRTIEMAIDDVADTLARMREFYRPAEPQAVRAPVSLNTLVTQVIELTQPRWRDIPQRAGIVIQVRTELEPDLPELAADRTELREALTNLVFNAVDAMPQGGVLGLQTRSVSWPDGSAGVEVAVSDSGVGMDEETRRRSLAPFFTTKGERGTGLGLAMVYGTVQRHGGDIEIESMPTRGTTVRLRFPVTGERAEERSEPQQPVPVRPLRLLVVDDDELVRRPLAESLQAEGHRVSEAAGGREALETVRRETTAGRPFDVVITDLGMPYVDGREVASAVKSACPSTRVVMLTGWGRRMSADGELPPGVDTLLSKPPRLVQLRTALAAASAGGAPVSSQNHGEKNQP